MTIREIPSLELARREKRPCRFSAGGAGTTSAGPRDLLRRHAFFALSGTGDGVGVALD
jgi:hypothetical protein